MLLVRGQLDSLYVFDRVLTDAERRTSQEARLSPGAAARCPRPRARLPGLPRYAKRAVDQQFARWVKLHVQSDPLPICTRPRVLLKGKRT